MSVTRRAHWPIHGLLLILAALASVATSYRPPPTHAPVYMSWEAFRRSARVLPPRAIRQRGKIYKWGRFLFLCEPNEGVHVFDNARPEAPAALAFIEAPGTIDVAARGRHLYLDSFVDLLVFELTPEPFGIRLVKRVRDVFPYDAFQTLPERGPTEPRVWPKWPDKTKGVVVGWKPVERRKR